MDIPEGFIKLIDYEEKYGDKLLIMFPGQKYRKNNIIWDSRRDKFFEIESVQIDSMTGYRIPNLIEN